jgi:Transposase DDE domain
LREPLRAGAELRANLQPGELLLGDRNFAEDYQLLDELVQKGCGFLFRLRKSACLQWQSQESLGAVEAAGAITRAGRARLGARARSGPWRVVAIEPAGREPVVLVSSAHFDGLSAAELGELYRRRWQVELFFRWLKCVLPCRHWFAESERGVSFQVYLSLICALLLAEALGRRPGKRLMEALAFRQMGWASEDELQNAIEREWRARQRRAARKKTA